MKLKLTFPIWAKISFVIIGVYLILIGTINILTGKVSNLYSTDFYVVLGAYLAVILVYLGAIAFLLTGFFSQTKGE